VLLPRRVVPGPEPDRLHGPGWCAAGSRDRVRDGRLHDPPGGPNDPYGTYSILTTSQGMEALRFEATSGSCYEGDASITEACCFDDGSCVEAEPVACAAAGGTSQGVGSDCSSVTCADLRLQACCFADGSCSDLSVGDCQAAGGAPQGVGTSCLQTSLCIPTATKPTTWGRVKGMYR
jgi:hypothetical protein